MWDKQEYTYGGPKPKENKSELPQNEMVKQFKGLEGEIHAKEEVERSVKVLEETLS